MQEIGFAHETVRRRAPADHAPTGVLIDHILERHHAEHRRVIPDLVRLAAKVEAVHEGDPYVPDGLAGALDALFDTLSSHMRREELILFPAMRANLGELEGAIAVMRYEHDDHAAELAVIRSIAHDCVPPLHACRSWRALYRELDELLADIAEHVRLENAVLFPRFETGL